MAAAALVRIWSRTDGSWMLLIRYKDAVQIRCLVYSH